MISHTLHCHLQWYLVCVQPLTYLPSCIHHLQDQEPLKFSHIPHPTHDYHTHTLVRDTPRLEFSDLEDHSDVSGTTAQYSEGMQLLRSIERGTASSVHKEPIGQGGVGCNRGMWQPCI